MQAGQGGRRLRRLGADPLDGQRVGRGAGAAGPAVLKVDFVVMSLKNDFWQNRRVAARLPPYFLPAAKK